LAKRNPNEGCYKYGKCHDFSFKIQQEAVIMSYYFDKTLNLSFDKAIARVTEELKKEGLSSEYKKA
jgi:hypothetical protein